MLKVRNNAQQKNWKNIHRDLLFEVEDVINLSEKFDLEITPDDKSKTYQIVNLYKQI